jgi:hypothetical protein
LGGLRSVGSVRLLDLQLEFENWARRLDFPWRARLSALWRPSGLLLKLTLSSTFARTPIMPIPHPPPPPGGAVLTFDDGVLEAYAPQSKAAVAAAAAAAVPRVVLILSDSEEEDEEEQGDFDSEEDEPQPKRQRTEASTIVID